MSEDIEKFIITCKKCKSTDVFIKNDMHQGSEDTGIYGTIELYCRTCGETEAIYE